VNAEPGLLAPRASPAIGAATVIADALMIEKPANQSEQTHGFSPLAESVTAKDCA
jgi:hypothetical protein